MGETQVMKKKRNITVQKNATYDEIDSPVGKLTIITSIHGLHAILWDVDCAKPNGNIILSDLTHSQSEPTIVKTTMQLREYFQGKRKVFELPIVLAGTNFQIQAWKQLQMIPYAETISYSQQAEKLGDKNKARAVGMANGLNPISIVVPCHRVIGSGGSLTGFAGGLDKKSYLLNLERANA